MTKYQYKSPFVVIFPDTEIKFIPTFDRVPSTGELVNTQELAWKYWNEVCNRNDKENEK